MKNDGLYLTVSQVAARWGLTPAAIWQQAKKGYLPHINVNPKGKNAAIRIPIEYVKRIEGDIQGFERFRQACVLLKADIKDLERFVEDNRVAVE
jgi:hypothetical protein